MEANTALQDKAAIATEANTIAQAKAVETKTATQAIAVQVETVEASTDAEVYPTTQAKAAKAKQWNTAERAKAAAAMLRQSLDVEGQILAVEGSGGKNHGRWEGRCAWDPDAWPGRPRCNTLLNR